MCMADPDHDHELVYTDAGLIDFELSPFFDPEFGGDTTVEGYVRRVRFLIKDAVKAQLGINDWFQDLNPDATIHPSYAALQQGLISRSSPTTRAAAATNVRSVNSPGDTATIRYLRAFGLTMALFVIYQLFLLILG